MGLVYCLLLFLIIAISPSNGVHAVSGNRGPTTPHPIQQNTISLHFANIEVSALLHELARLGGTNFLLSEAIQGRISLDTLFWLAGVWALFGKAIFIGLLPMPKF
jgi:type IV pilus assembly protein PilQ